MKSKKARFEDAKVGDRVYCRNFGFGTIKNVNKHKYEVMVMFDSNESIHYTIEGKLNTNRVEPLLFYVSDKSKYCTKRPEKVTNYKEWKVDDKIYVTNSKECYEKRSVDLAYRRYFSHIGKNRKKQNAVYTFDNGATSWSDRNTTSWLFAWKEGE